VSEAYALVKPALVKVWAFNASGLPADSGTGFVVQSDANETRIVTALHVVSGSSKVAIDVSPELHDIDATVVAKTSDQRDIALLLIEHGDLQPVKLATRTARLLEGKYVATAGYFKYGESIGEAPQLLGPGTIGSFHDAGKIMQINLGFESGLSGGPVFDPATGDVLGVVNTKSTIGDGGYATSGPLFVDEFVSANISAGRVPVRPPPATIVETEASSAVRVAPAGIATAPAAQVVTAPVPMPRLTPTSVPTARTAAIVAPIASARPAPVASSAPVSSAVQVDRMEVNLCFGHRRVKLERIIEACTQLIGAASAQDGSLVFLYNLRANAYRLSRHYDSAIVDANRVLRINPNDPRAYATRGSSYNWLHDPERALDDANAALRINPNYAAAYALRGAAFERKGVPNLALSDYNKAVSLDRNQQKRIQTYSRIYNP
jgi:hypothetical protein